MDRHQNCGHPAFAEITGNKLCERLNPVLFKIKKKQLVSYIIFRVRKEWFFHSTQFRLKGMKHFTH